MTVSDPLRMDDLGNRTFKLALPLYCYLDNGDMIEAPTGSVTDLASTPRIIWSVFPPFGPYSKGAVIHDVLYKTKGFGGKFTRKESDDIFYELMLICGTNAATRNTMYSAVRAFSGRYWNKPQSEKYQLLRQKTGEPLTLPEFVPLDERTEKVIRTLDRKCQNAFRKFATDAAVVAGNSGCKYIGISGNRTWKEQDELYALGRTRVPPYRTVTNAKGGYSNHNFGIAVDFGVFRNGTYLDNSAPAVASQIHKKVASDCADYGLDWGGNWTTFEDQPHFEYHTGLTMKQKRAKYLATGSVL